MPLEGARPAPRDHRPDRQHPRHQRVGRPVQASRLAQRLVELPCESARAGQALFGGGYHAEALRPVGLDRWRRSIAHILFCRFSNRGARAGGYNKLVQEKRSS